MNWKGKGNKRDGKGKTQETRFKMPDHRCKRQLICHTMQETRERREDVI